MPKDNEEGNMMITHRTVVLSVGFVLWLSSVELSLD